MNKESKININASNYAISHCDSDKTYNGLEVHKMLCDAYIAGNLDDKDEKIRKALINVFATHKDYEIFFGVSVENILAWLEKQGETNIQNNKPFKIESDKFYFCIKDYFAGGCYRSKKGDVVLAQNGMNMMGLSPKEASEYFIPINPFKEHVVVDWFEKEREKPQGKSALEARQEMVDNTNKIEPKFKVGDWVVQENIGVYKVIEICKSWYEVIDSEDNHYSISFDKECMCHLWTIDSAKAGDVLVWDGSKCITLFKNIYDEESFNSYGLVGHCTGIFEPRPGYHDIVGAHPATKEQCGILFAKMKEAGYEWDFDKKELKKIEDEPENYKLQVMSEMTNLVKDYIQQKPTWSEDDEKMFHTIIADLKGFKHDNTSCLASHFDNCITWLKSLKDRYTWKRVEKQGG